MPSQTKGKYRDPETVCRKYLARSFREKVPLKSGEKCSLRRHFRGAALDLIGYLERTATTNRERFVWTRVKNVPPSKKGRAYKLASREKAMEFLRNLGVVTVRLRGKNHFGHAVWGVQVFRHDDVCRRTADGCEWIGPGLSREPLFNPNRRITEMIFHYPPACPCPECSEERERIEAAKAAKSTGDGTGCGTRETAKSTRQPPEKYALGCPEQPPQVRSSESLTGEKYALDSGERIYSNVLERVERMERTKTEGEKPTAPAKDSLPNEETGNEETGSKPGALIGDVIAAVRIAGSIAGQIRLLTDGEFTEKAPADLLRKLVECCLTFAEEIDEQPFRSRETLAAILDSGMKRLRAVHGRNAPASWLPIIRKLRLGGRANVAAAESVSRETSIEESHQRDEKFAPPTYPAARFGINLNDAPAMSTFRDAWRYLASLPELPPELVSLRDEYWDRDVGDDKPESPPWATVRQAVERTGGEK